MIHCMFYISKVQCICQLGLPQKNSTDWLAETIELCFLTVLENKSSRSGSNKFNPDNSLLTSLLQDSHMGDQSFQCINFEEMRFILEHLGSTVKGFNQHQEKGAEVLSSLGLKGRINSVKYCNHCQSEKEYKQAVVWTMSLGMNFAQIFQGKFDCFWGKRNTFSVFTTIYLGVSLFHFT